MHICSLPLNPSTFLRHFSVCFVISLHTFSRTIPMMQLIFPCWTLARGHLHVVTIQFQGIRVYIFDDEIVQQDESTEPEVPPKRLSTLSGLGSSSKPLGASGGGKYDGFGNSPISKGKPHSFSLFDVISPKYLFSSQKIWATRCWTWWSLPSPRWTAAPRSWRCVSSPPRESTRPSRSRLRILVR